MSTVDPSEGIEPNEPEANEPHKAQGERPRGGRWAAREDAVSTTLDSIGDLQRRICGLQAEQVRQVAAFVEQRNSLDADLGIPMSPGQYRSLIAEVSLVCNLSTLTAQSLVPPGRTSRRLLERS